MGTIIFVGASSICLAWFFKSLPSASSCAFGSYSPGRGSLPCSGALQEDQRLSWEVEERSLNFISQKAEVCVVAVMISETEITWFSWFGNFRSGITSGELVDLGSGKKGRSAVRSTHGTGLIWIYGFNPRCLGPSERQLSGFCSWNLLSLINLG